MSAGHARLSRAGLLERDVSSRCRHDGVPTVAALLWPTPAPRQTPPRSTPWIAAIHDHDVVTPFLSACSHAQLGNHAGVGGSRATSRAMPGRAAPRSRGFVQHAWRRARDNSVWPQPRREMSGHVSALTLRSCRRGRRRCSRPRGRAGPQQRLEHANIRRLPGDDASDQTVWPAPSWARCPRRPHDPSAPVSRRCAGGASAARTAYDGPPKATTMSRCRSIR